MNLLKIEMKTHCSNWSSYVKIQLNCNKITLYQGWLFLVPIYTRIIFKSNDFDNKKTKIVSIKVLVATFYTQGLSVQKNDVGRQSSKTMPTGQILWQEA